MEKDKGKSKILIWIMLIIIALIIVGLYLYKRNDTNTELSNNTQIIENDNSVKIVGLNEKYTELTKAAISVITEENSKLEYDLNNDEKKEIIRLETNKIESEYKTGNYTIYYNSNKIESYESIWKPTIYIVDLEKNDNLLDIVFAYTLDNNGFFGYDLFKNTGKGFTKIQYTYENVISNAEDTQKNYYEGRLFLNNNSKFVLLNNVEVYLDEIVSDKYFEINGNVANPKKIDISSITNYIFKYTEESEPTVFFSKTKEVDMENYTKLENNEEFVILEWVDNGNGMKVKLSTDSIGYIYPVHGYIAG